MKSLSILSGCLFLLACAGPKASYQFPKEMLPHVRAEYLERCDRGKRLYELNCSGCHTIGKGRNAVIPDFDQVKLQGYAIRIANARHISSMPDSIVSEEELVLISNFLLYKTPSGKKVGVNKSPDL